MSMIALLLYRYWVRSRCRRAGWWYSEGSIEKE
jgi:hypothetical protein